jgi:hypothetical protein
VESTIAAAWNFKDGREIVSDAMNDSFLDDMQQELVALLKSDEDLGTLPILDERLGDIAKEVEKALGLVTDVDGKLGACVIVQSPSAEDAMPAAPGGSLETDWTFLVLEEPTLNDGPTGHQKRALRIARRIVRVVKLYAAQGLCTSLIPRKPTIVPFGNPMASIAYRVSFHCTEQGQGKLLKVAQPTLAPASGAAPANGDHHLRDGGRGHLLHARWNAALERERGSVRGSGGCAGGGDFARASL